MIEWYKKVVLENYANFEGRARRSEYWYFTLINLVISIAFSILTFVFASISETLAFIPNIISIIYSLAILVPSIAVGARRLHDIGKSGWFQLVALIPFVGVIVLIYWFAQDGVPGSNEYGENPKEGLNALNEIGNNK